MPHTLPQEGYGVLQVVLRKSELQPLVLTEAVVHEGHELATNFCPCLQFGSSVEGTSLPRSMFSVRA